MAPELIIIDYGMGNLRSVERKVARHHPNVGVSADPRVVARAAKLVLPGVGHFASGVRKLKAAGLWDVLNERVLADRVPILGICLGMQLMTRGSEEGDEAGLGWFDAHVVRFQIERDSRLKVPHMGWNTAERPTGSRLFANVPATASFYFVHAYHLVCAQSADVSGHTTYEYPFASAIEKEHLFGTQFHPEKSHHWGEQLIANFARV